MNYYAVVAFSNNDNNGIIRKKSDGAADGVRQPIFMPFSAAFMTQLLRKFRKTK